MTIKSQNMRKSILAAAFLLFEYRIFHLFFSPVLLLLAASQGIINGSLIIYGLLFLGSLFFGRAWCGWVCPGCAVNEATSLLVQKRPRKNKWFTLKYVNFALLMTAVTLLIIRAGGIYSLDPFFGMSQESSSQDIILLFGVVAIMVPMNFLFGRQAHCHYLCWQAPILIAGTRIKNFFRWPSLHVKVNPGICRDCGGCDRNCPMGLNISQMVRTGFVYSDECILCRNCVDHCPNGTLEFSFSRPARREKS